MNDRRLIEVYLPIKAISKEASREKSIRKGHISTLHLWWARRPLVACRAAVYGALVPADQFQPKNGPPEKRKSLGRANAAKFLERLCKYPGNPQVIKDAQKHILKAHAERLTKETGKKVTREDIEQGRAPRPKVLDMFAGGGAIPLEALRLGCEAYALELNPVAHIIELCTLVYPQKYGKPDASAKGMTGPKNDKGETTWGGLAEEVRYWGNWVLEQVREEIGDLYPLIPDPESKPEDLIKDPQPELFPHKKGQQRLKTPGGYLIPVAYLWTRTVKCKNPSCEATVPLVKQTWLCKKKGRYIALRTIAPKGQKRVRFEIVEALTEKKLGFDPSMGSKGGNATCPFCGTVADSNHVKQEGQAGHLPQQLMAVAYRRLGARGKVYLSADMIPNAAPDGEGISKSIQSLCKQTGLTVPSERIEARMTGGICLPYGLTDFGRLYTLRQMLFLLTFAVAVREAQEEIARVGVEKRLATACTSYLSLLVSTSANSNTTMCRWIPQNQQMGSTFSRQALAMTWDFCEIAPLGGASGDTGEYFHRMIDGIIAAMSSASDPADVVRGSATTLPWGDNSFDAVVTDPPYYDNIDYAKLSDFFYVWLKRTVCHLYPEHFAAETTPKKAEAVADPVRHGRSKEKARRSYEKMMVQAFSEAHRVLKPGGEMVVVYAHKTTLGWATLVDALRDAGFTVNEAWPLDTEKPGRLLAHETAALASSIFRVARKRDDLATGSYENDVRAVLHQIVRERVDTFWEIGISGADLVIAAVGAGLRAFTRFARVEYANGEEVPTERFLAEVETKVLETILRKLSKAVGANASQFSLAGVDAATRFYILWRYTYKYSVLDSGEAIIFANGTHVELDGPNGLSTGARALLEKKKGKYSLKDFSDRGSDKKLGQMMEDGQAAPMVDALHRTLWLMENRPGELPTFLQEAQPNREQMRLVAQALAGPALKGGEFGDISPHVELSALTKLTANWKSVIEDAGLIPVEKKAREAGQRRLFK